MIFGLLIDNLILGAELSADNNTIDKLKNDVPADTYKSDSHSVTIDVVFPALTAVAGIGIVNHNLTTLEMQYSSDNFNTFESHTFTVTPSIIVEILPVSGTQFRFICMADTPVEVGQAFLARQFFQLPDRITYPIAHTPVLVQDVMYSDSGQRFCAVMSKRVKSELTFKEVNKPEYYNTLSLLSDAPKILVTGNAALFGHIINSLETSITVGDVCDFKLVFEQFPYIGAFECLR